MSDLAKSLWMIVVMIVLWTSMAIFAKEVFGATEPPPLDYGGRVCTRKVVKTPTLAADAVYLVRAFANGRELDVVNPDGPSFAVSFIGRGLAVRVTTSRKTGPAYIYVANLRAKCSRYRVLLQEIKDKPDAP